MIPLTGGYAFYNPHISKKLLNNIINLCIHETPVTGHMPVGVRLSDKVIEAGKIIARLFNPLMPVRMHLPPMVRRVDPGDTSAAVPRHQDLAYNRHIQGPFITAWLTLTDIDDECGGIAVYPGTNGQGELPRQPDNQYWLGPVNLEGAPALINGMEYRRVLKPPVGTVVLMTHDLVHESMPNVSDHPRYSIDYRFFAADVHSSKPSMLVE